MTAAASEITIGIDLGTTNSAVAFWDGSRARLIRNAIDEMLTPSAVGVNDRGKVTVGAAAKERLITHPHLTAARFKQWMGTDRLTSVGSRRWRAEELSALMLKSLYEDALANLPSPPRRAVISAPAYFSDPQRKATLAAARLAGLPECRLVNEPTAAALAYGLHSMEEGRFVVLDLGGGTFDVTILDKYSGVMEARASAGDSRLGGEDFTDFLTQMLADRHRFDLTAASRVQRSRLRRFAETLKRDLSSRQTRGYALNLDGHRFEGELTREAFAECVSGLTARLRGPVERALRDSGVDLAEIDQVILVGGATRMPLFRKLASRLFGRIPLSSLDPDHIVAMGAAVRAAMDARCESLRDVVMTDVCPHTLGTSVIEREGRTVEEVISPIVERNAVVPISRARRYSTVHPNQTSLLVEIYQGECLRPKDNVRIGELNVTVPRGPAGRETIDVRFTYDSNGALEVEVTVLSTGEKSVGYFEGGAGQLDEEEIRRRFEALKKVKIAPRDELANASLIAHGERLYAESCGETREIIKAALMRFVSAIERQQNRTPEEDREELKALLEYLERRLFGVQPASAVTELQDIDNV
jgi:molecular chaperone HscC